MKQKLIRITTVTLSLDKLLSGKLSFMNQFYKVIGISSEKEIAYKIKELIDNPILYNQTIVNCQERAKQFDISLMVPKHISLYNSLYEQN
jgi:hypothetical protein